MISCENNLGLSLAGKFRDSSLVECRHVGVGSCVTSHWFYATPHWFARAPPWLSGRPRFVPLNNIIEALAQLGLLVVASPARPWLPLGSNLALVVLFVCLLESLHGIHELL